MVYLISISVKGVTYYVNVPGVVEHRTTRYTLEGLKNNATEFYSKEDAERTAGLLVGRHVFSVIPKNSSQKK